MRLLTFLFLLPLSALAQTWVPLAPLPAAARQGPSSFVINGKAYVMGGWNFNTFFTELWMYDPVLNAWSQKAELPGPGRQFGVAFAIEGIGYYGTGNAGSTAYTDWYAYDPTTDTWTQKASLPGIGRTSAVGFTLGGLGYVATGGPNYSNNVYRYDPVLDQWTTLPNFAGTPRRYAAGFVLGEYAYVCNGQGSNGHGNTCWRFDPMDDSWTQVANYPTGCSGGMAITLNDRAQLFRGYNGAGYQSTIYEYDPQTDAWTQLANFTGGIRAYATTFMIDGEGYLAMGFGTEMQNDLWKVGGIPTAAAEPSQERNWCTIVARADGWHLLMDAPAQVQAYDAMGREVWSGTISAAESPLPLTARGTYVLRVQSAGRSCTERVGVP
jgi:N-acetylneuraminic acid mutarotase